MSKFYLDLKLLLTKIPEFFTNWCIVLFILTIIFKSYITYSVLLCSQNLILTTSIVGYYLLNNYGHNILKEYPSFDAIYINISNYIFHLLPLFYILLIEKQLLIFRNSNDIIWSVIFSICFFYVYLKLYNPEKTYWFTGYKRNSLILIALIFYILCFIIPILFKV